METDNKEYICKISSIYVFFNSGLAEHRAAGYLLLTFCPLYKQRLETSPQTFQLKDTQVLTYLRQRNQPLLLRCGVEDGQITQMGFPCFSETVATDHLLESSLLRLAEKNCSMFLG